MANKKAECLKFRHSANWPVIYTIPNPPLAKPVRIVAISIPSVTLAEKTSINLVPADTGILSPVVTPLEVVPMVTRPLSGGASVTEAPGTGANISLGVVEL